MLGIILALAIPLATCGQEIGDSPGWSSGQSSGYGSFVGSTEPLGPAGQGVSDPSILRLPSVLEDATDTSRNRALEIVERHDATAVRRYRQGFFQRLRFSGVWIDQGGDDGLGIGNLDTSLTVAIPLGSFENLLLVTTDFEVDCLNGPTPIDVPSRLYNVGVDLMWRKQFNERWGSMLAVRPALASDFQTSQDAIRITGRALATWQWVPDRLSLLFGVVYLDRNDLPVLPGAGLIWTPNPDWRLDLIFPRPKLARRLVFLPRQREDWVYLAGSLGGRS